MQNKKIICSEDGLLIKSHLFIAYLALGLGGFAGLLQVFIKTGKLILPFNISYYQVLTVHGVLLALVFTTFFIFGFMLAAVSRTAGCFSSSMRRIAWLGYIIMVLGTIMAVFMILLNKATVLYTFYAPLQAHWIFYAGLAFIIFGSWLEGIAIICRYAAWKKANKGRLSPLLTFMAVVNTLIWIIASLGVAGTIVFQLIPWSLGWHSTVNVVISRTLFWYFGHPLVYFWLLTAYMSWYVIIPKIIGWKLYSDSLARFSFLLFLIFSIPVGFHHQLMEPGIGQGWKFFQVILTFVVIIPSFMTAFSMFATFEAFGRSYQNTGLFSWLKKLPWKDARFLVPFIGMIAFIPGGAGGIINASSQMNAVVHNTLWITGHFHLTISTTVTLTFFGISYFLIPHLTGRTLTKKLNKIAIIQGATWAGGMTMMSGSMHIAGLLGAPRRTAYTDYGGAKQASDWMFYQIGQAIGGSILFISLLIALYLVISLAFFAPKGIEEFPVAKPDVAEQHKPLLLLENWKLWISIAIFVIIIAYAIPLYSMIQHAPPGSSGYKLW
ncbi:b(o/a)3-type cytochrome-c oxidase subunit 1 [Niallia sp. 03133]|uniref:b(o/a)3-type cytochrome-c oxidase subunit 1 n=1 Tax=Niallia sp. 03133 TaxID=3458060 RepID=UPI004043F09D